MSSHHRYSRYFPAIFLVADLVCLNIGLFLAHSYLYGVLTPTANYQYLLLLLNLIWIGVYYSSRLQEINRNSRLLDHLNKVLTGLVINLSIVFALWFAVQPEDYSRKYLFITYLIFTFAILFWRSLWHYLIRYYRIKGYNYRNVLIIGKGELSDSLSYYFKEAPELGYRLIGVIDEKNEKSKPEYLDKYALENNMWKII